MGETQPAILYNSILRHYHERISHPMTVAIDSMWHSSCMVDIPVNKDSPDYIRLRCGAVDENRDVAKLKAIVEAVERHSGSEAFAGDLVLSSWKDLSRAAVSPDEFAGYSAEQCADKDFPFHPFDEETIIRWTRVKNTFDGSDEWVPASSVFVPYTVRNTKGEQAVIQAISTGAACHPEPDQAVLNGILEVLERDAISLIWQCQISCPRLNVGQLEGKLFSRISQLEEKGFRVILLDASLDHAIPIVIAILHAPKGDAPPLLVGTAADLEWSRAISKALNEAIMLLTNAFDIRENLGPFDEQIKFWMEPQYAVHLDFLQSKKASSMASDPVISDVYTLMKSLEDRGFRVLLKDLSNQVTRQCGLYPVKVVIPGMQPLAAGYRYRCLRSKRLKRFLGGQKDHQIPYPFL